MAEGEGKLWDQLDALSDFWLADATTVRPSEVPRQLYHYTDAAGLSGMLSGHIVWMTDYRFLNDRSEIAHTRTIIDGVVDEKLAASPSDLAKRFVAEFRKASVEPITPQNAFVFSLSRDRDDLSQWRGYAKEGRGFTIGFDAAALHAKAASSNIFTLAPVEYRHDRQHDALSRAFDAYVALLDGGEATDEDVVAAGRFFNWLVGNRGAFNKHRSFEAEREWRAITYPAIKSDIIKVRVSGHRLVPYIDLELSEEGEHLPIQSIGVGPGFIEPEVRDAVLALAHQHGYDVEVYAADTPFRRL